MSLPDDIEFRSSSHSGTALVDEARRVGAAAVVVERDCVADLEQLPDDVLFLGLSSAAFDVLVACDGALDHLWNPTPDHLMELIRQVCA